MDTVETRVFRRHAGDATLLVGGAAAILLQLADPRVARGVARHSAFRDDPMKRLRGTLDYVYAVGFGDERLARAAAAEVNARHRPVRGGAKASAPAYSAFDVDAQRFVASTLLAVGLDVHERVAGPIDERTADIIVRGYAPIGGTLQSARAGWPETRREFDEWWTERMSLLEVGDDAREVARALLVEPNLPRATRLALPPLRLVTAALLPEPVRSAYGFRTTPKTVAVADGWFAAMRIARAIAPRPLLRLPMHRALRRVEERSRYAESGSRGR